MKFSIGTSNLELTTLTYSQSFSSYFYFLCISIVPVFFFPLYIYAVYNFSSLSVNRFYSIVLDLVWLYIAGVSKYSKTKRVKMKRSTSWPPFKISRKTHFEIILILAKKISSSSRSLVCHISYSKSASTQLTTEKMVQITWPEKENAGYGIPQSR